MHSMSPRLHLLSDQDSQLKHESPVIAQTSITSRNVFEGMKGGTRACGRRSESEAFRKKKQLTTAKSVAERVSRLRSAKTVQVQVVDVSRSIREVGTGLIIDSDSGVSPVGSSSFQT